MQPIQTVKNQYRGINAHLHSYWQGVAQWNNFHNAYISSLMAALKKQLLPMGYTAFMEDSIQIRRTDEYQRRPISEKPYSAVVIQKHGHQPVAWIELLSPSNKRPGDDALVYLSKREDLLDSGIVLVELDYLHETPPTLPRIPNYSRLRSAPARPYRIVVFEPRPQIDEGWVSINEFEVDEPIPTVTIPLNAGEFLTFDFGQPYQKLYEDMLYGLDPNIVDYRQLPVHFDRYSPTDQLRILTRMLTVIAAEKEGVDLEQTPLPLIEPPASIEAALALLETR